ncbi:MULTISPECIES: ATP-grasp domain-containing protein [unclassified Massilia]|uniref:ATP-grasp domain-containing protein n=1 Tax=unclassified Massilia TaxID=2609279 RepID=UPI0018D9E216|nr:MULTISPECIES: ATP-grasp domain-containing protein [unclassified Massilia]
MAPLKVFAFDYVMEGGAVTRALPRSFTQQGAMLFDALLADLAALPDVEVCTMATLCAPEAGAAPAQSFTERFASCVQAADAVWPLAPESGGLLESLSRDILRGKRILLGSAPGAVRVAASKLKVARALAEGGVATVPTYRPHAALPDGDGAWVVKPEDGSGCLDTRLFSDRASALAWIRTSAAQGYVLQPFVAGKLCSLSLICCDGAARLLARNHERVAVRDNRFHFLGSTVNGLSDADGALERLAQQVAAALPTLWGYVGVDVILGARGAVVLDVNPRLTAAYAGLHASIGCNPAGLVIDLLKGPAAMPAPPAGRRAVSVDVDSFPAGAGA